MKLDFFVSVSCCTFFSALSLSLTLSLLLLSPAFWFSGRVFAFSQFVSFQKGPLKWWDFEITCFVFWFPRDAAKMFWPDLFQLKHIGHVCNLVEECTNQIDHPTWKCNVSRDQGFGSDWAPALFPAIKAIGSSAGSSLAFTGSVHFACAALAPDMALLLLFTQQLLCSPMRILETRPAMEESGWYQ